MTSSRSSHVGYLARRSLQRTLRQPAALVFPLLFPLILLAVNARGLEAATHIPGFPTDSFFAFALAIPFMQGALFAASSAGTDLARDIETGFLDRLALTPVPRWAMLAGQLAGAAAMGLFQSGVYLAVGLAFGVHIASGAGGAVVLLALATVTAIAFAGLGALMALRTGSGEAVQGLFPLMFVALFLSSMNLPRPLIEIDWFRNVATYNPFSYLIEGLRSLVITGWDARALILAFGIAVTLAVLSLAAASRAMRLRVART